jgi:hypothetical protein
MFFKVLVSLIVYDGMKRNTSEPRSLSGSCLSGLWQIMAWMFWDSLLLIPGIQGCCLLRHYQAWIWLYIRKGRLKILDVRAGNCRSTVYPYFLPLPNRGCFVFLQRVAVLVPMIFSYVCLGVGYILSELSFSSGTAHLASDIQRAV